MMTIHINKTGGRKAPFYLGVKMKPGDLIFVKGTGFLSHEIESITHSPYSHVAGNVAENELIEAQGFRRTGYQALDYYSDYDVYTCDLTDEQRKIIIDYVRKEVGSRYDYLLILWELIRFLFKKVFPYHEGKTRICSTLWNDAYLAAGVKLCDSKYPTPGELAQSPLLRKAGTF